MCDAKAKLSLYASQVINGVTSKFPLPQGRKNEACPFDASARNRAGRGGPQKGLRLLFETFACERSVKDHAPEDGAAARQHLIQSALHGVRTWRLMALTTTGRAASGE